MRTLPKITITQKGADLLRGGHVWVYADEVTAIDGTPNNGESDRGARVGIVDGDLTDVYSPKGRYLGTGFYNSHSKIPGSCGLQERKRPL